MIHDTVIKVGDKTVTIKSGSSRWDDNAEQPAKSEPAVVGKVVAPPEKKEPRKSTGARTKEV